MTSDPISAFVAQLQSPDRKVRQTAVEALGRLGDQRAVEYLLPLAYDVRWEVQGAVAEALGLIGDLRALVTLYEMFEGVTYAKIESDGAPHRFDAIVGGAAIALARLYHQHQDSDVWNRLMDRFRQHSTVLMDSVSLACIIHGLPYTGDFRVTPLLLQAASMSNPWVQFRAIEALGILRNPESLPILYQTVETGNPLTLVEAAADALAIFGVPEADQALMNGFQRLESQKAEKDHLWHGARVRIVRALGIIGTPKARHFLKYQYLHSDRDNRTLAAIGLAYMGDKQILQTLIAGLSIGHLYTQTGVVEAMHILGDPKAALPLRHRLSLQNLSSELEAAILKALQQFEGRTD